MQTRVEEVRGSPVGEPTEGAGIWLKVAALLVVLGVIGTLLVVPYSISLLGEQVARSVPPWIPTLVSAAIEAIPTVIAVALGLWLGVKVGLGAWDVSGLVSGAESMKRRVVRALPLALLLGAVGAIVASLMGWGFSVAAPGALQEMNDIASPPIWQGFLASIGAGIREEIWLRLGLMGFVAWLISAVARLPRRGESAPAWVMWTSMAFAALIFGAMHLPNVIAIGGGLNIASVVSILSMNGALGILFGWIYWRKGLIAAMVAHFATDIVLKAFIPALMVVAGS